MVGHRLRLWLMLRRVYDVGPTLPESQWRVVELFRSTHCFISWRLDRFGIACQKFSWGSAVFRIWFVFVATFTAQLSAFICPYFDQIQLFITELFYLKWHRHAIAKIDRVIHCLGNWLGQTFWPQCFDSDLWSRHSHMKNESVFKNMYFYIIGTHSNNVLLWFTKRILGTIFLCPYNVCPKWLSLTSSQIRQNA